MAVGKNDEAYYNKKKEEKKVRSFFFSMRVDELDGMSASLTNVGVQIALIFFFSLFWQLIETNPSRRRCTQHSFCSHLWSRGAI